MDTSFPVTSTAHVMLLFAIGVQNGTGPVTSVPGCSVLLQAVGSVHARTTFVVPERVAATGVGVPAGPANVLPFVILITIGSESPETRPGQLCAFVPSGDT